MLILFTLAAATAPSAVLPTVAACRRTQLRLSIGGQEGEFNGMSHAGARLLFRNVGNNCLVPALPEVVFRDARGRPLPAFRTAPSVMHPGPAIVPVRLAGGHRAAADLRWVSGPVFPYNHRLRASIISARIGNSTLSIPLKAVLYGGTGRRVAFDQTPLHAIEGMPAG